MVVQCRSVAVSGCCHCHDHATPPAGRRRVVPATAPGWVTYARGVDGAIVVETFMDSLEPAESINDPIIGASAVHDLANILCQ